MIQAIYPMHSTILVVEDEPAIAELLSVNLGFAGHKVMIAGDAEAAMAMIATELPDLVLLDWMLPGMSGAFSQEVALRRSHPGRAHHHADGARGRDRQGGRLRDRGR